MQAVQTPVIPTVANWIQQHPGTISLGQGIAFYPPPPEAQEALADFWEHPQNHHYKGVDGIAPLQEQIHLKLLQDNKIDTSYSQAVVVTPGSNMAFLNAMLAVADAGDEVILITPYYFNHEMALTLLNIRPVCVPTDDAYQLDLDAIKKAITPKTRAVVTVSPNNPSGAVYPKTALRAVNLLCHEHGLYHVHDEAYEYFVYEQATHFSPGSISGSEAHTISLFSLSKSFGFAGWRIGYMVIPSHLHAAIAKAQDTHIICPAVASQIAAVGAMKAGAAYTRQHLASLRQTRSVVLDALKPLQDLADIPTPMGAFYVLLRLHQPLDPIEVVHQLIAQHGVAVLPGTTFGLEQGCYLRVAYGALQSDTIAEGIGRLVTGLQRIN